MHLIANCNLMQLREMATAACGKSQLCAGLRSGIEASLHAVRAIWPQSAGGQDEQASDLDGEDGGEEEGTLRCQESGAQSLFDALECGTLVAKWEQVCF